MRKIVTYSYDIEMRVVENGEAVDVLHNGQVYCSYTSEDGMIPVRAPMPFTAETNLRLRRECREMLEAYRKRASEDDGVSLGSNLDLFA